MTESGAAGTGSAEESAGRFVLGAAEQRRRRGDGGGEETPRRGHHQDAPQERSNLRVHAEHGGVPAGARVPARAPSHHPEAHLHIDLYMTIMDYMRWMCVISGYMSSPPDEAQLLSMLLKLTGARKTIEVGVFTGCSVLATALAIPDDGKVVAIDVSREYFDLGMPVIQKAGVAHKVDFREGPAQPILEEMLAHGNEGKFDFAFVDADKGNYGNYHEQLLRLVRVGGVLVYDNTLWGGTVAMPDETPLTEHDRRIRDFIRAFNAKIAADQRVEVVQLPIADGITLCRRVV